MGPSPHLTCGKTAVGIKAEDGISVDGTVREEAVTDLQWEGSEGNSAVGTSHSEYISVAAQQEPCRCCVGGRAVKTASCPELGPEELILPLWTSVSPLVKWDSLCLGALPVLTSQNPSLLH